MRNAGGGLRKFGNAKIGDIGVVVFVEEDVAGFEIAVDDTLAVCIIKSVGEAQEDICNMFEIQFAVLDAFRQ